MDGMKNINELIEAIKSVENGVNGMIVPLLKDTIEDTNKHNKRLFVLCIMALLVISILGVCSQYFIFKQNDKYNEFLSQFEIGTGEIYQDLDAFEGGDAIINSGISISE